MNKEKSVIVGLISLAAVAGNVLFVLWIFYNGINENFQGTILEKISYITLMGLLSVNAFLIVYNRRNKSKKD